MNPILKKMNYKDEHEILILNTPKNLRGLVEMFSEEVKCKTNFRGVTTISFAIVFVLSESDIKNAIAKLEDKLIKDANLWFCYPKKSSKKYKSEINRDNGWNALGELSYEPVRQVSISDDFSALRFRKVSNIKKITRSKEMAMTKEAKERTTDITAAKKEMIKAKSMLDEIENPKRRKDAFEILSIMDEVISDHVVVWENRYIGYGHYHYVNKTNEGDMPVLSIVPAKAHMTMYFAVGGLNKYVDYLEKLGKYKRGKICLYISNMDNIDKDVFRELIKVYYEDVKKGIAIYS